MSIYKVLVIGGYGFFGRRLVKRLSRHADLHIVVAGRSQDQAIALVKQLEKSSLAQLSHLLIDAHSPDLSQAISSTVADVVIHTCGPFQGQGYEVAQACLRAGAHYIDLADGREFVSGIVALDAEARRLGLSVISGASSVPALSSAVVDHLAQAFESVREIDVGISPGNRTERGLSTVQSILSYCGKPIVRYGLPPAFGWTSCTPHFYPMPVGRRLLSPCDVPDLSLLPNRYPGRPSVHFGAGLELSLLHRGMNVMAWLTRMGLVRDWSVYAKPLKWMSDCVKSLGTDTGAMHVSVNGRCHDGISKTRTWHLLASHGDGPYIPTLAAAALVNKLKQGEAVAHGATACIGILTLEDFIHEANGLHVQMSIEECK